jgi:hypothetical protein
MRKVYLLLRDNRQTGPYTIDELKQQHLRPSDMVWEEGSSFAWRYPNEIPGLTKEEKGTSPGPAASGSRVRSNSPAEEIEAKAEELRKRALSYTSSQNYVHRQAAKDDLGPSPYYFTGEKEIEIVYHRKEPSVTATQLVVAGIVGLVLAAGWYGRDLLVPPRTAAARATVKPFVPVETPRPVQPKAFTAPETIAVANVPLIPQQQTGTGPARKTRVQTNFNTGTEEQQLALGRPATTEAQVTAAPEPELKAPEVPKPEPIKAAVITTEEKKESAQPEPSSSRNENASEEKERKTIGQAIKGLFKKKNKD